MNNRHKRGFTLIELMIVVAIIAILAAIAVPWWGRYTYRARRTDGQKILMHVAQAEERYYTDYNAYPLSATSLDYPSGTITSENGYYTVSLAAAPGASAGQGYVATATPVAGSPQANDACGPLSIDNTGVKKPLPTDAAHNSNGSCW
ncbi:MAG TPA: type IV pilin protein [Rhodanobacteraceae bacterium]|nr:type IV pilin protein [Rhodanobacteraceae bacterium]